MSDYLEKDDVYMIDSHKLMFHPERLSAWLKGDKIFPIYAEVGLFGGCNHRCVFCAFDYLGYRPSVMDTGCIKKFIREASRGGVKAILYSGEGEPLLHKDVLEIISFTKSSGIDVALATNGVFLDKNKIKKALKSLSWIKVSLDAGTEKTYSFIHGVGKPDFKKVLANLQDAVKIRNGNGFKCVIGAQCLLLKENYSEVGKLALILRHIGVDYLAVKPYCPHNLSGNKINLPIGEKQIDALGKTLHKYSTGSFRVILRKNAMQKSFSVKPYNKCFGLSFATHITAQGDVYPCNAFVGVKKYCFGNIKDESFSAILFGKKRKKIVALLESRFSSRECRNFCRLDEINRFLWKLKHPGEHINFI